MWLLMLIAISTSNASDVPAQIILSFDTKEECLKAEESVEWKIKYSGYEIQSKCEKY